MNLFELFVKIGVDDKASPAMKNTQKNSETLANKMKSMSAQFESAQKNIDNLTKQYNKSAQKTGETSQKTQELSQKLNSAKESLETTKNKLAVLASQYDTAKKNVADLTKEFNKSAKETGASSKETQELAKKLDDAEKEAEQAKKALDGYNSEVEETGEKTEKASGGLSNFASKLGSGLKTAAKIGTAAVATAAAGITALTKSAIDNYAEYEQLVGGVETLFKDSADVVKKYANEAYKSAGLSANEYMSTVTSFSASLLQNLGRGAQTDLNALKENLDEQYDATKKSWQDRIKIAKKLKQNNVAELEAQMDAELKALKKGNEQKLAEAETANNKSVVTAKTQELAADLANQAVIDMADNAAKMGTSMEMIQNAYAGFAKQNYTINLVSAA